MLLHSAPLSLPTTRLATPAAYLHHVQAQCEACARCRYLSLGSRQRRDRQRKGRHGAKENYTQCLWFAECDPTDLRFSAGARLCPPTAEALIYGLLQPGLHRHSCTRGRDDHPSFAVLPCLSCLRRSRTAGLPVTAPVVWLCV